MACGNIRRTGIDELSVHLVGEKIESVLLHYVTELIHLAAGIEISCRVVWVADEDGLGALGDEFLEFLHRWKRKAGIDG